MVFLEDVVEFAKSNAFAQINNILLTVGCIVKIFALNSKRWVPQGRGRFYAVAVRRGLVDGDDFKLCLKSLGAPLRLEDVPIVELDWVSIVDLTLHHDSDSVFCRNIGHCVALHPRLGRTLAIADFGASRQRPVVMADRSPTITCARATARRLYLLTPDFSACARLGVHQLAWLQGWGLDVINGLGELGTTQTILESIGNAMTLPVVTRIFGEIMGNVQRSFL